MRLLHTSDWHLGKKLFGKERLPEQELFLEWLLQIIAEKRIDTLLMAGDIFDTPTPPHQALKLFFDFLQTLTTKTNCRAIFISGNHDSSGLIEAPRNILANKNIHFYGQFSLEQMKLPVSQEDYICLDIIPYFRHYELLQVAKRLGVKESQDSEENLRNILQAIFHYFSQTPIAKGRHSQGRYLISHHLFGSFHASGSEQGLSLSGLDSIPLSYLSKHYQYVAIGHIHRPQILKKSDPLAVYPGSPIPMRFSEQEHKKVVLLTTNNENHGPSMQWHDIPIFRELIRLQCDKNNYRQKILDLFCKNPSSKLRPFVEVQLSLKKPEIGLHDEIHELFNNNQFHLLNIHTLYGDTADQALAPKTQIQNSTYKSAIELFNQFYLEKYPNSHEVPKELIHEFTQLIEQAKHEVGE